MTALYTDIVQDSYGRPIPGVEVLVLNSNGTTASLTNQGGSPISNPVLTDTFGVFSFYAADNVYNAEFRYGGVTIREDDLIVGNPPAYIGPAGPSSNGRVNLAALKAAATTDLYSSYDGSLWTWTTGDFSATPAAQLDVNVVKANSTALSVGAWIRQLAAGVAVAPSGTLVRRSLIEYVRDIPLNAEMFGAVGNGTADDTGYVQAMLTYGQINKREIAMRPNSYRVTDTLNVTDEVRLRGFSGSGECTNIFRDISDASKPTLLVYAGSGESIFGLEIGYLQLGTLGSYAAGWAQGGVGLRIDTASGGPAVFGAHVHDVVVLNHSIGLDLGGVIYKSTFERIQASGNIPDPSKPTRGPTIAGFRSGVISYYDITYNTFSNLEATQVRDGAYAYNMSSQFSTWINCTADGPSLLSSVGGVAINHTCESFTPTSLPAGVNNTMNFTQFASIIAPCLRNVPAVTGLAIGIFVGGDGWTLIGARNDGTMPGTPIYLGGGVGTLLGIKMTGVTNKIPATGAGGLNGSVAINCDSVTDYGLSGTGTALRTVAGQIGFYGGSPVSKPTLAAAATDAATTQALANDIRAKLIAFGLSN